jgi:NADPH-dependent 2,4-dienoyl-CoA reductase/sulfur reductase-like enzyme
MRATLDAVRLRGRPISISYEGRPVACHAGDTVAAALVDAGEFVCRTAAEGDLRGVFCGMGVCHDCVVAIDGVHGRRACTTAARDGMAVAVMPAAPELRPQPAPALERREHAPEVLVVGGGPGGLAASIAAAEAGADVVLLDEREKLGGQYFKQLSEAFDVEERAVDRQYRQGRELIARAGCAGVRTLAGVEIWAAAAPDELHAVGAGFAHVLRPRRLVVATGAYERAVPLPGWTLPGVMTTGAAQTLLRAHRVLPGRRVLVSGNGPLNVQVAAELVRGGAEVVALCELARAARPRRAPQLARMLLAAPDLARDGARYVATLRRARVPLLFGSSLVAAEGDGRVTRATVARLDAAGRPVPGSERSFEVDAVCLGYGFLPSNELARAIGVEHVYDDRLAQLVALRDDRGRTSVDGVWVVGDSAGTGGARLAAAGGFLSGLDAARSLGRPIPPPLEREERRAARARARNARFQQALSALYAAPRLVDQLARPETLVCRCERVPLAAVEEALGEEIGTIGALKRVTRAGMGPCQGRYCAPVLAELAARRSGGAPDPAEWFAPAPPFKPLSVALGAAPAERTT